MPPTVDQLNVYEPPPPVMESTIAPSKEKQVVGCVTIDPMTGSATNVTEVTAIAEQPLAFVTVAVYVVVVLGVTVIAAVVAPVFQE